MNNKVQFWTTFVIAVIGALAWTPSIIKFFQPNKIVGKMISRYSNLNKDQSETYFIFKLAILSKNKDFNLKRIKCEIEDINGNKVIATAQNSRIIVFVHDGQPNKLLIPSDTLLNNTTLLPEDKNIVGYLYFKFNENFDRKFRSTSFIFESFDKKIKELKFKESEITSNQLFFDDKIWKQIDDNEIKENPLLRDFYS